MKNKFKLLLITIFVFLIIPFKVNALEKDINIYLFYGDGCPHCAAEEKFLDSYLSDKSNVKLYKYEVWYNKENQELLQKVQEKLDNKQSGVPYTVIGKKVIVGYSDDITSKQIKRYISYYTNNEEYRDYVGEVLGTSTPPKEEIKENENARIKVDEKNEIKKETKNEDENVDVPVLGSINPKKVSLPLLSVVLGFVDGFNPCAMWILIFLITMLFNMKDRKKMWILGLTFILTSGVVYLAFMLTWLNLATFISKISLIRLLVATISIVIGIVNITKYVNSVKKKDEGCDVVDRKERKKIMENIKKITTENKFILSILGIMVLAASVNIIELMCSIGIPLLFTQILAMNNLTGIEYGIYMFIYIFFFLIDDLVVFFIAMKTSKIAAISTKYTKYSHLIGGIIMLIIGALLVIKPELLMFNF